MKIEFKVIAPKKGSLEKQAWEALKRQLVEWLEGRLRGIECSEHHQHPRVTVTGSLRSPKFRIEGCCQRLVDEATEALK
ncbi:MAG TPA: hypothetical protein PLR48_06060 [Bacillota bacterium]|nr:hypothetical protein [Bacillota bacterium]